MIRKILAIFAIVILVIFIKFHFFHPRNLLQPITVLKAWHWEQFGGASGGLYPEDDSIRCEILKTDGTDWHVQLYQVVTPLVDGREYRLHFLAKADGNFKIGLNATTGGSDIHSIGIGQDVMLDSKWTSYDYTFKAEKVAGQIVRVPDIMLGKQTGKVWIKDIVVSET